MTGERAERLYPVFLDLARRPVVVIGSGPVAARHVRRLLRAGADVTVIAGVPGAELDQAEVDQLINVERRDYVRGDLSGMFLALCADIDEEIARAVVAEAESVGCLVNVVNRHDLCNFLLPSVVTRGPLQIAVSTAGASPELARAARVKIQAEYGPEWGEAAELLAQVRGLATARLEDPERVAAVLGAVLATDPVARLAAGERLEATAVFEQALSEQQLDDQMTADGESE